MLHARKHRRVSVPSVATEQKSALTVRANGQISLQLLSIEAKSVSREARQVPCEPKTLLSKQVWRAKQKAPCEVSGEVPAQLRLSREDKGKMPIQFGSIANISREAKMISLSLPNLKALAPSANLTPMREVTDGVANTAPVPKGTNKVLSREVGTEALCSAKYWPRLHSPVYAF